jgi:hypothetical protein
MGWIVLAIILTMSNHIVNNRSEAIDALEKDLHMQDLKAQVVAQKAIIEQLKLDNLELEQEVACRTETNERQLERIIILDDEVDVLDELVREERQEVLIAENFGSMAIRQRNEARAEVSGQKSENSELRVELQNTLRNLDGQTSLVHLFLDTAVELEDELEQVKAAGNTLAKSVPCTSRKAANALAHYLNLDSGTVKQIERATQESLGATS